MLTLCGEIHEEDGVDPRNYFSSGCSRDRKADHATKRLCVRVKQTLEMVAPAALGDCGGDLGVEAVAPAPNASRLLVTLVVCTEDDAESITTQVETCLALVAAQLRSEVAAAITRRKTPTLDELRD